jgi:hypothetical protein
MVDRKAVVTGNWNIEVNFPRIIRDHSQIGKWLRGFDHAHGRTEDGPPMSINKLNNHASPHRTCENKAKGVNCGDIESRVNSCFALSIGLGPRKPIRQSELTYPSFSKHQYDCRHWTRFLSPSYRFDVHWCGLRQQTACRPARPKPAHHFGRPSCRCRTRLRAS